MAAPQLAPGLQRKLKKVLEIRTETPEIVNSLSTLSEFYVENSPAARRQLRSTTENQGVKINQAYLDVAEGVIGALNELQVDLDAVLRCCDQMTTSVSDSKSATADLLHETDRLKRALAVSETRSQLVSTFLEQYQLSPVEAEALQTDDITEEFFAALDHVTVIHSNCKSLLRTHHQRAGLELMDAMGTLQEKAYERLCRWVQGECRGLSETDAPDVNPLLQRAANTLRERQVLFRYCAEEVAAARHTALFQRFIRALTRGARPIEMHAPDPIRYVNDMLAWVHTSLASEREFLVALFGEDGDSHEPKNAENETGLAAEGAPSLLQLLDSIFESICRPLKVRIEQVLMSSPPPFLCFRLSQLLTFYLRTVDAMLGPTSQLSDALRACRSMASRIYYEQLKQKGDKLARYPPVPPPSLAAPQQLVDGSQLLAALVDAFETSMDPNTPEREKEFDAVLAAVTEPLLEMCERSSEALNPAAATRLDDGAHLDPADQKVYLLNCMHTLAGPLTGRLCAAERAGSIGRAIDATVADLVRTEVRRVLTSCGLAEIADRLAMYQRGKEMAPGLEGVPADDAALSLNKVSDALRTFFGRLSDPAVIPELPKLQVPLLKAAASNQIGEGLANSYATVYEALLNPESGYDQSQVLGAIRHTPAQVRTLLGL